VPSWHGVCTIAGPITLAARQQTRNRVGLHLLGGNNAFLAELATACLWLSTDAVQRRTCPRSLAWACARSPLAPYRCSTHGKIEPSRDPNFTLCVPSLGGNKLRSCTNCTRSSEKRPGLYADRKRLNANNHQSIEPTNIITVAFVSPLYERRVFFVFRPWSKRWERWGWSSKGTTPRVCRRQRRGWQRWPLTIRSPPR